MVGGVVAGVVVGTVCAGAEVVAGAELTDLVVWLLGAVVVVSTVADVFDFPPREPAIITSTTKAKITLMILCLTNHPIKIPPNAPAKVSINNAKVIANLGKSAGMKRITGGMSCWL